MVFAQVQAGLAELAKKTRLTAERAWQESRCIATSDIGEIFDFTGDAIKIRPASEIPESARRAIKSVKIKVKRYLEGKGEDAPEVEETETEVTLWDKPGQLNTTLTTHGQLKEIHEQSGLNGRDIPIVVEFARAAARPESPDGPC